MPVGDHQKARIFAHFRLGACHYMWHWAPAATTRQAASRLLRYASALRVTRRTPRCNALFMAGSTLPAIETGFVRSTRLLLVKYHIYVERISALFGDHPQMLSERRCPRPGGARHSGFDRVRSLAGWPRSSEMASHPHQPGEPRSQGDARSVRRPAPSA